MKRTVKGRRLGSEALRYSTPKGAPQHFVAPRVAGRARRTRFSRGDEVQNKRVTKVPSGDGAFVNVPAGSHGIVLTVNPSEHRYNVQWSSSGLDGWYHEDDLEPSSGGVREASHVVADFNTLDDLVEHAGRELGATHISSALIRGTGQGEVKLYFPRGGQYPYEEARVWRKNGYWHADGPGARVGVERLPQGAVPIGQYGRPRRSFGYAQPAETRRHSAHDYEAVDNRGRRIAGPFKSYGDARSAAGSAGAVRFVPGRTSETRRSPRGGSTRRISSRAPEMSASGVLKIARDLSQKVGGTTPQAFGAHRWSDRNESAVFTTYSPEYSQPVVVLVSVFADGTVALDFFSDESLSEMNRYENIVHFLYSMVDLGEMAADLKWVWETVDGYAASWQEGEQEEGPHSWKPEEAPRKPRARARTRKTSRRRRKR